jgi:hypothetical protein
VCSLRIQRVDVSDNKLGAAVVKMDHGFLLRHSINMAEFDFAVMLMESSMEIEKVFDNERSSKSWCNWLWNDF